MKIKSKRQVWIGSAEIGANRLFSGVLTAGKSNEKELKSSASNGDRRREPTCGNVARETDMENYEIRTHGLNSTSKPFGELLPRAFNEYFILFYCFTLLLVLQNTCSVQTVWIEYKIFCSVLRKANGRALTAPFRRNDVKSWCFSPASTPLRLYLYTPTQLMRCRLYILYSWYYTWQKNK